MYLTETILHPHLVPQERALEFITAGNSTFTLKSLKTGAWFTYKAVAEKKFDVTKIVVKLLTGSDNENSYSYLCTIFMSEDMPIVRREKSRISKDAKSFIIFDMVFGNLLCKIPMPTLEIWHQGKCCRCGRTLTVPESIELGIGPECIKRENAFKL